MEIKLRERTEVVLKDVSDTFKIDGSSFVFMKIDVSGFTVVPKKPDDGAEEPKPIKVMVPEGMETVVCLNTGKTQFMKQGEKVKVVDLEVKEVLS